MKDKLRFGAFAQRFDLCRQLLIFRLAQILLAQDQHIRLCIKHTRDLLLKRMRSERTVRHTDFFIHRRNR